MAQEWFRHDFNAPEDPKLIRLRIARGYEAIGLFWTIIPIIGRAPERRWPARDIDTLTDALKLTDVRMVESVVDTLVELGLLCRDENWLWSSGTQKRMEVYDGWSEKSRLGGIKSGESRRKKREVEPPFNHPSNGGSTKVPNGSNRREEEEEKKRGGIPLPPYAEAVSSVLEKFDGSAPLSFDQVIALVEGQRDPEKLVNVSNNERGHLHKRYFADGRALELSRAVVELSKTPWRGTIEQIDEIMAGKPRRGTQPQGPKTPAFKPKPKPQAAVTAAEAFAEEQEVGELPF